MATPYLGEIRLAGFNFAPLNWAFCNGALLSIAQNDALFALIGTTYGGDGQTTFALPDLRGRCPIHQGTGGGGTYVPGQIAGSESVVLTTSQIPAHTHAIAATSAGGLTPSPSGQTFAANSQVEQYETSSGAVSGPILAPNNGAQAHENRMPYVAMNYIIALAGIFPSRS